VPLGLQLRSLLGMPHVPPPTLAWFAGNVLWIPAGVLGAGLPLLLGGLLLVALPDRAHRRFGFAFGVGLALLGVVAMLATPFVNHAVAGALVDGLRDSPPCAPAGDPIGVGTDAVVTPTSGCGGLVRETWTRRAWRYDTNGGQIARLGRDGKIAVVVFARREHL